MSLTYKQMRQELLNSGRDDLVAAVEQLVDIGTSQGGYNEGSTGGQHARRIGNEINRVGGFRMMQEMHKVFVSALSERADPISASSLSRDLEKAWDGIGSWDA